MERIWIIVGASLGGLGVVMGAFGAHGLKDRISAEALSWLEIGVRYQFIHALAILFAAWALSSYGGGFTRAAPWLFVVGVVLFSGTLYLMALGGPRWLGAVTPLGGTAFIAGWICLAVGAFRNAQGS